MSRRKQLNPKPLKRTDSDIDEPNDSSRFSPPDGASAEELEDSQDNSLTEAPPDGSSQQLEKALGVTDLDRPHDSGDSDCRTGLKQAGLKWGERTPPTIKCELSTSPQPPSPANAWTTGQPETFLLTSVSPSSEDQATGMLSGPPVCPKPEPSSATLTKDPPSNLSSDTENQSRNIAAYPCTDHNGVIKAELPSPLGASPASPPNDNPSPPPPPMNSGFQCLPCGITFSNQRNLQAHQTLYCAYRHIANTTPLVTSELNEHGAWNGDICPPLEPITPKREGTTDEEDDTSGQYISDGSVDDAPANPPRSPPLGPVPGPPRKAVKGCRTYRCPRCPFTADRRSILAKHTRMHEAELSPTCGGGPSDETCSPKDRYCSSCNIQFMSYNTCQVHKLYYCSSRHGHQKSSPPPPHQLSADSPVDVETVVHPTPPSVPATYSSAAAAAAAAATNMLSTQTVFAAISTNPLILVPCSFVRGKGIVPTTGFLPGESVMQINGALPSLPPTSPHRLPSSNPRMPTSIRHPPPLRPRPPLGPPTHSHPVLLPGGGSTATSATYIPQNKGADDSEVAENSGDNSSKSAADPVTPPSGSGADDKPLDLSIKKKRKREATPPSEAPSATKKHLTPPPPPAPPAVTAEPTPVKTAAPPPLPPSIPLSVDSSSSSSTASSNASSSSSSTSVALDELPDNSSAAHGQMAPVSVRCVPQPSPPPPLVPITDVVCSTRLPLQGAPSSSSAPLVKQGNNVCKECNIVFYRYDNYIAHKLHYCASRRSQLRCMNTPLGSLSPTGTDATVATTASVTSSPLLVPVERKRESVVPVTRTGNDAISTPHFRCTACGVKFSSPDTLQAHQTYYCPRRETTLQIPQQHLPQRRQSIIKRNRRHHESVACPTCKTTFPSTDALENHQCVVQWKCPYCDVICPTLTYAQHHLATHADVRSFCCTVCGYRGNTLRGMRTHVRVHFDVKNASSASSQNAPSSSSSSSSSASSTSLEETFIACVTEDGTITPLTPADKGSLLASERGDIPATSLRRLSGEDRASSDSSASVQLPSPKAGDAGGTSPSVSSTTATFFEEEGVPDTSSLAASDTVFRCECCGFSSTFSESVIQHVTKQHGEVVTFNPEDAPERRGGADAGSLEPDKEMSSCSDGLELRLSTSDDNDEEEVGLVDGGTKHPVPAPSSPRGEADDEGEVAHLHEGTDGSPKHHNMQYGSSKELEPGTKRKDPNGEDVLDVKSPKVAKTTDTEMSSFRYLSKFIAHRKFYCVTRLSPPVSQETPPVQ